MSGRNPVKSRHTYNMGIIGNCSYIAYIDDTANVKWLCLPRFDSSFTFGSLLDENKGGEFSVRPVEEGCKSSQKYLKNTNVLMTTFETANGNFRVIDFAPRFYQYDRFFRPLMLVRKIELCSGTPYIKVVCKPVGQYGRIIPEVVKGSNHLRYLNLESQVRLTTGVPLDYILEEKSFLLNENQYLVFTYGEPMEASIETTCENFLEQTTRYWQNWIKTTSIPPLFQGQIIRSALTLKLHQYENTGGIIAAGTLGLPENSSSNRTWDYRYCWMRDTYYTLTAFNYLGHFEELEEYFHFIQNIILNEKERIKPLYTITGGIVPGEKKLALKGYLDHQPVRIGNNAGLQVQNDVYGQVLVSLLPLIIDKRLDYYDKNRTLKIVRWLLERISATMDEPDSGIWEYGNLIQQHSYTLLFHWAGSRAAWKIGEVLHDQDLKLVSQKLIKKSVKKLEECYHPKIRAYTQAIGSDQLDASALQLITLNYLDPHSQKCLDHLDAIRKELETPDGLLYRYVLHDDLGKPETSFLICSFWYAEALACMEKLDESYLLIEKLIRYSNHLGLFSEDADFDGGQWGNFPQTYTHVGLMNAVYRISVRLDKPIFL